MATLRSFDTSIKLVCMNEDEPQEANNPKRLLILKAWRRWFLLYVPFMALILLATRWLDFSIIMSALIVLLLAVLLYQSFANRRSWQSIMWGVHANDE